MAGCEYCDREFESERSRLEHELDQHGDELTGHEKDQKKSDLNRLEQKRKESRRSRKKKLKYGAAAAAVLLVASAAGFQAYQSIDFSSSAPGNSSAAVGEPVHWHAPYTVKICGERKTLQGGPKLAHTHGQHKFHLEGVRATREQATLGWIMEQLGAPFSTNPDSIMGRNSCNGEPANLTVKVNGQEIENPGDYVVRDGDVVTVVFE